MGVRIHRVTLITITLVVVSAVAVAAVVIAVREATALRNSQHELVISGQELSQSQKVVKRAVAKVLSITRQLNLLEATTTTTTTTTLSASPIVVTDPQLLISTLDTASLKLTGLTPPPGQDQEFVAQFQAAQVRNEELQNRGLPSVSLDPMAEAESFIKTHDAGAMYAYNASQMSQILNCMIAPGSPQCAEQNSP